MSDLLNGTCTETKPVEINLEVIKEGMERIAEEGRKRYMHLPFTHLPLWIEYKYGYKPWSKESKALVKEAKAKGYIS